MVAFPAPESPAVVRVNDPGLPSIADTVFSVRPNMLRFARFRDRAGEITDRSPPLDPCFARERAFPKITVHARKIADRDWIRFNGT
jgi:hypothetical protein